MMAPTQPEIDAAIAAMKRSVERCSAMAFSDLVIQMATAALVEGFRVRERASLNAARPRHSKAQSDDDLPTPERLVEEAVNKMEADLSWTGPTGARQGHVLLPRPAAEALYLRIAENIPANGGWVLLADAPIEQPGPVYSFDRSWGGRTDISGQVHQHSDSGERFVSSSAKGFKFTHWHPPLEPPTER